METLGSVTVLASDKTGTLTEGRMAARSAWTPGTGRVALHGPSTVAGTGPERLLRDVVLCNDAQLTGIAPDHVLIGDPMEAALLVAAADNGLDPEKTVVAWPRIDEVPFDSDRQYMVTVHRREDGNLVEVVKGAPEVVLAMLGPDVPTDGARAAAQELAKDGYRVLAVADRCWRPPRERPEYPDLVGLVAIADPPRADAAEVVAACRAAGIRTVLITGDHPATAHAIARQVGIVDPDRAGGADQVMEGGAVARGEHRDVVERVHVYARTHPGQKVDIVDAWRARGHVVAMTGDGVNDGPALRRADIGVAMGDRGTEVARQAADVVLADDNLRTLITAVGEGRRIYANIRTFLRYGLAGGLAEVLVILIGPFIGLAFPLGPAQILWINMLTHGVPGVAFDGEPLDPRDMHRPSPSPERSVLGGGLVRGIVTSGVLIAVVSLVGGLLAQDQGWHLQTSVFVTLGLAQLWLALALRAPRAGWSVAARGLEAAVAVALVLQLLAVWWPPLTALLGTAALSPAAFSVLLALSCLPALVIAAGRWWQRLAGQDQSKNASRVTNP